jgi:hypothetical protein
MSSLAPVPSESATCSNCGTPLVADQRYCLSCGQPCSPVRLAFLDVLSSEQPQVGAAPLAAPVAYAQYIEPAPGPAWLRRYAPLFAVVSVLLLAMIIGLLVGHWVTQSKAPSGPQVIKVEGLSAAAGTVGGGTAATTTPSTSIKPAAATSKTNASSSKEEKEEEVEAKAEEAKKVLAPKPQKVSSSTLSKIDTSTGRKHQEELNKIGTAPIAVP